MTKEPMLDQIKNILILFKSEIILFFRCHCGEILKNHVPNEFTPVGKRNFGNLIPAGMFNMYKDLYIFFTTKYSNLQI